MKELRIRGLVGSIISLIAGLGCIAFLALPMLVETPHHTIYTVFESIFKINEVTTTLATYGGLYVASVAFMIIFMVIAIALIALSIVSLVGVCQKKYTLSMAVSMRALSLANAVIATLATVLLVLYFSQNNLVETTFGAGPIVALAASLIGVGSAFVLPSVRVFLSTKKKEERLALEQKKTPQA